MPSPPTRRRLLSPAFLVTAVVLAVAAIAIEPGIAALMRHYDKQPIDLRRSLLDFDPTTLPSFRFVPDRAGFGPASQGDDLGTDEHFELVFAPRGVRHDPKKNVLLFVTYYSDPRDQIPHTPEVCYRQAGATVNGIRAVTVETPGLEEYDRVEARLLDIENHGKRQAVLYVICCNGEIFSDRERTRLKIGWPGDRHIYFSKIEVVAGCPDGASWDEVVERCATMLGEALPALFDRHFPSNDVVRNGR